LRLVDKREVRIGWVVSSAVGVILIYLSFFAAFFTPQIYNLFIGLAAPLIIFLGTLYTDLLIIVALIIIISPPAALYQMRRMWKRSVDRNLPELLRDVANAQATGMTFIRALEVSSQKDYGPLSFFLKKALAKVSWGVPYEAALSDMANRIDTSLVRKAILLIVETGRIGGNIREIMDLIARHTRSLENLERERLTAMRPNIFIIYLGFIVLVVSVVLIYTAFISELFSAELAGSLGAIVLRKGPFTQLEYLRLYLHMTAIVAFFGGLIAGQMGEDSVRDGLKHAAIMLVITLMVFATIVV